MEISQETVVGAGPQGLAGFVQFTVRLDQGVVGRVEHGLGRSPAGSPWSAGPSCLLPARRGEQGIETIAAAAFRFCQVVAHGLATAEHANVIGGGEGAWTSGSGNEGAGIDGVGSGQASTRPSQ